MQDEIRTKGEEIFREMAAGMPALFDRKRWAGTLMNLAMADPDLKVRLFRFVDVLPSLHGPAEITGHLREYFPADDAAVPPLLKRLLAGIGSGLTAGIAAELVKRNIVSLSRTFIVGETPEEALRQFRKLWREGSDVTVDLLGEAALSESESGAYSDRCLELIGSLAAGLAGMRSGTAVQEGIAPRLSLSVKISSLFSRIGPLNFEESVFQVKERLRPICRAVRQSEGSVTLDMESYSLKNITLAVFRELLEEEEFRDWRHAGIALQAYLPETWDDLQLLIDWAKRGKRRIGVRLVKGAYWEYETVVARQKGWPLPVFDRKSHTDWNFERCTELLLEHGDTVSPAIATHNVRSLAAAMVAARRLGVSTDGFEFQMLYGMAEPVKGAVRRMGYYVREYAPLGELLPGMAYLVRRLLENTSNEGFLRRTFAVGVSRDELLAAPESWPGPPSPDEGPGADRFTNEPTLDFSRETTRIGCRAALEKVRGELGGRYPAVIAGREWFGTGTIVSVNPARPAEVVGSVAAVDRQGVRDAFAAARAAQSAWGRSESAERAEILFRTAELARSRRLELLAWQLFETGKNRAEADADVTEAIDFMEYYGREILRLGRPVRMGDLPGEDNRYSYRPRGVALVIAPWNFPLAISAGMTAAALAAGNTVLYKPSSLSVVTGWQLCSLFREAGVPSGVLNFIPCRGEQLGEWLDNELKPDLIAFTGSREAGLRLLEQAARHLPEERAVTRVIAEMGGKNAIIVDSDADLDLAVAGVVQSAFSYAGQKCSACSRVIVLEGCYDRFLERLGEAVRGIVVGPPDEPACFMGPLIDMKSRDRVAAAIARAEQEGRIVARGTAPTEGQYLPPTVVAGLPPDSPLLREELFGPVLAVIKAANMDEALAIANDSDYALTGGLYSRSPVRIRRAMAELAVGNLYINRGITGAMVGRQPFGGFRLSGIGSKAGGPDYLQQFMEPRVITENTMRRGFAPESLS